MSAIERFMNEHSSPSIAGSHLEVRYKEIKERQDKIAYLNRQILEIAKEIGGIEEKQRRDIRVINDTRTKD